MTRSSKPFHLCLVCDEYPPCKTGGIGIFSRNLARRLIKEGNSVTVVGIYQPFIRAVEKAEVEDDQGVTVYRLPPANQHFGSRIKLVSERLRLTRWIRHNEKEMGFDIIESPDFTGSLAFYNSTLPTVVRLHGSYLFKDDLLQRPPSRLYHLLEKRSLKKASLLISVSQFCGEMTMKRARLSKPFTVIHNAVDTDFFKPDYSVTANQKAILYFGTVSEKKGITFLIKAMEELIKINQDIELILMGKVDEKYKESILRNFSTSVTSRIHFTGHIAHGEDFLSNIHRAKLCVFPSLAEAFGLTVIEAMACGKPTIITNKGPGPEIIENGVSGLLCNPCDHFDISKKINTVLHNQDFAQQLGYEARKKVIEEFSLDAWAKKNREFFNNVIKNHS